MSFFLFIGLDWKFLFSHFFVTWAKFWIGTIWTKKIVSRLKMRIAINCERGKKSTFSTVFSYPSICESKKKIEFLKRRKQLETKNLDDYSDFVITIMDYMKQSGRALSTSKALSNIFLCKLTIWSNFHFQFKSELLLIHVLE